MNGPAFFVAKLLPDFFTTALEYSHSRAILLKNFYMSRIPWRKSAMKLIEIKEMAKQHNIKTARMNKAELIRAIQLAERNEPCFATGVSSNCCQGTCLWREECE
jgi:hypothetical protein